MVKVGTPRRAVARVDASTRSDEAAPRWGHGTTHGHRIPKVHVRALLWRNESTDNVSLANFETHHVSHQTVQ